MQPIGEQIAEIRKLQGISQRELSKVTGIGQNVIARLETGTTNPNIRTIITLLNALDKMIKIVPIENE